MDERELCGVRAHLGLVRVFCKMLNYNFMARSTTSN